MCFQSLPKNRLASRCSKALYLTELEIRNIEHISVVVGIASKYPTDRPTQEAPGRLGFLGS